jgi:hypothetical protein
MMADAICIFTENKLPDVTISYNAVFSTLLHRNWYIRYRLEIVGMCALCYT